MAFDGAQHPPQDAKHPRKGAGADNPGHFANKNHDAPSGSLGEPGLEDIWFDEFSGSERSVLTRKDIAAENWGPVVAMMRQDDIPWPTCGSKEALVQLHEQGFTPHESMAVLTALNGNRLDYVKADRLRQGDDSCFETMATWPDTLPIADLREADIYLRSGIPLYRLAEVHSHLDEMSPVSRKNELVIKIAESEVNDAVGDRYGANEDWNRAYWCLTEDVDPAQAQRWNPLYPKAFLAAEEQGWTPEQLCGDDDECQENRMWSHSGFDPKQAEEWKRYDFDPLEAKRMSELDDITPAEGSRWRDATHSDVHPFRTYIVAVHPLRKLGIDVKKIEDARKAGFDVGAFGAGDVLAKTSIEELEIWGSALGANRQDRGVNPREISLWRDDVGCGPAHAGRWRDQVTQLPVKTRTDMNVPNVMRFVNQHVDPGEVAPSKTHPMVVATSRALGIEREKLQEQADRAKNGTVEACRSAFRRRQQEAPF